MPVLKKICLITGASRGIGRIAAEHLAARGHVVYATMRDSNGRNAAAAAEVSKFASVLELDVTHEQSITAAIREIETQHGRLDAVVNNAGFVMWGPVEEIPIEAAKRLFDVNFFGALRVSQAALPLMRRQGSGVLVQMSSISGRVMSPMTGMYQASKFALEAMSEALAFEAGHFGVRVVLVEPGIVGTNVTVETAPTVTEGRSAYRELQQQITDGRQQRTIDIVEPTAVAQAIVAAIENPDTPLRVVIGDDAKRLDDVRRTLSDAEYADWLRKRMKLNW